MKRSLILLASALSAGLAAGAVYVDVETGAGTFTIEMDAKAKNGGAAFLGLAEGWVDWVDPRTGEPRHGARYHDGTAISWVYKEGGESVLVGNLGYAFKGVDVERFWNNGAGIQMQDDITGPTGMTARSVAMVQEEGPHCLDGRWAVVLGNADDAFGGRWSRIGTVVSNWGVVEALAARATDGNGWMEEPVTVTGTRVHGDAGEIATWRAVAESNAPACGWGEAGVAFGTDTVTVQCRMPGKGRYGLVHTTNLQDRVRILDWMNWYDGDGEWEESIELSTADGAMGKRHFFGVVAEEYPEMSGPPMDGNFSFRAAWEMGGTNENLVFQYDLDMGASTGMVYQLDAATQRTVLRSAPLNQIITQRTGAHSTGISFVISAWVQMPYYWLGEEREGDWAGRFRVWEYVTGLDTFGDWMGRAREE